MDDEILIPRATPIIMSEPDDAPLTGHTRNLERRLLALNLPRPRNEIEISANWVAVEASSFSPKARQPGVRQTPIRYFIDAAQLRCDEQSPVRLAKLLSQSISDVKREEHIQAYGKKTIR